MHPIGLLFLENCKSLYLLCCATQHQVLMHWANGSDLCRPRPSKGWHSSSARLSVSAAKEFPCSQRTFIIHLNCYSLTPTAEMSPWDHCPSSTALAGMRPTLPWATSSLWAAEADFTNALVAAAMDLAASRICSSKFSVSSACWGERRAVS